MADLLHRRQHESELSAKIAEILERHRAEWEGNNVYPVKTERDLKEKLAIFLAVLFGLGSTTAAGELGIALVAQGSARAWADQNAGPMARRILSGIQRRLSRARVADLTNQTTIVSDTVQAILLPKNWGNLAATEVTRAYTAGGEFTVSIYNIGRIYPGAYGPIGGEPAVVIPKPGDILKVPPGEQPPMPGEPLQPPVEPPAIPEPALAIWNTKRDERVCTVCEPLDGSGREDWALVAPLGPPAHDVCRCWLDYSVETIEHVISEGDCGANAPGGGGFQKGNTCASGGTKQTDSEAFKDWFGDSKIVDADGNPLVVYHGTSNDFNEFKIDDSLARDSGFLGRAIYVTRSEGMAASFGPKVMPLYLRAENPFDIRTATADDAIRLVNASRQEKGLQPLADDKVEQIKADWKAATRKEDWVQFGGPPPIKREGLIKQLGDPAGMAMAAGHDAVFGASEQAIAFLDPNQVKSATGNRGTWSRQSRRIDEQAEADEYWFHRNQQEDAALAEHCGANAPGGGGFQPGNTCGKDGEGGKQTDSAAFKAWFGDSKVVDENGKPLVVYHGTNREFVEFKASGDGGIYFGASPDLAAEYSAIAARYGGNESIVPVYLRIERDGYERLTQIQGSGKYVSIKDAHAQLQKEGFDGYEVEGMYVVFSPTQIKSATGNKGTFDPSNPDIREQVQESDDGVWRTIRGVHVFIKDGKITKGPKAIVGKSPDELDKPAKKSKATASKSKADPAVAKAFAKTAVVDANGDPLKVFHGTQGERDTFDPEAAGSNTGAASAKQGIFFVKDKSVADGYARTATPVDIRKLEKAYQNAEAKAQRSGKNEDWDTYHQLYADYENAELGREDASHVVDAYINIENPLTHDYKGEQFRDQSYADIIAKAKRKGHDGVIFLNTYDDADDKKTLTDIFVVFDGRQAKSASKNNGDYDFTKPSIYEHCGANGPGGKGFQPGNTCAAGDGDGEEEVKPTPRVLGVTDEVNTCDKCGKTNLKSTVMLDLSGNGDEEPVYYGSDCAGQALLGKKTAGNTKTINEMAKGVEYAKKWSGQGPSSPTTPIKFANAIADKIRLYTTATVDRKRNGVLVGFTKELAGTLVPFPWDFNSDALIGG